jgi:hypothetical protein
MDDNEYLYAERLASEQCLFSEHPSRDNTTSTNGIFELDLAIARGTHAGDWGTTQLWLHSWSRIEDDGDEEDAGCFFSRRRKHCLQVSMAQ